jgi:hypothetical protein
MSKRSGFPGEYVNVNANMDKYILFVIGTQHKKCYNKNSNNNCQTESFKALLPIIGVIGNGGLI